jgi:Ala-tRNA(Pro) deacylase
VTDEAEQPAVQATSGATATVLQRLLDLLHAHGVAYRRMDHPPVYTSQQAAQVRGTSLRSGAKALVCKMEDRFALFVLPADHRLANRLVRQALGVRHLRFATPEEVWQITHLRPGSIPPFGSLFGLTTYCDQRLTTEPQINFNAGDHCVSLTIEVSDFLKIERPIVGQFAEGDSSAS